MLRHLLFSNCLLPDTSGGSHPEDALRIPGRLIAQIMDIGTFEDIQILIRLLGKDWLIEVLRHAEPGWFRPQSWAYWHYRLRLTKATEILPPESQRKIA